MKIIRPGLKMAALAITGATAIAACGSSNTGGSGVAASTQYPGGLGSIPAQTSSVKSGGTVTWAESPGAQPNWILPIDTSNSNSVYNSFTFQWMMWRPLYWQVVGTAPAIDPSLSLASMPVWSNGGKTATITMKGNYKWSNGQPVTSKDLLLGIDVIKAAIKEAPSNWAAYTPGYFPDDVTSMSTPNSTTLVLNLSKPVNPTWYAEDQLQSITPLPQSWANAGGSTPLNYTVPANAKKIWDYLNAQSKDVKTYATNPLWQTVDGPFKLTAYNATNGDYTLTKNPSYSGPFPGKITAFQAVAFTSDTAEFNAVKSGSIDVGYIPQTDVPQIPSVKRSGYNVFGYPDFGWTYVAYNFADTTGHFNSIIGQLYIRQAIAHLEDQQGYINAFMHGAGGQAYGPVPAIPSGPFTPADALKNPYPFSVSAAKTLLASHGWKVVPGGTSTCVKPGSAANECGAGIPAGTPLSFNLIYSTQPTLIGQQVTDLSSKAKSVGMAITLQPSNFNYIISNYNNPGAPANKNKWAMEDFGGFTNSVYPTTQGVFNSTGAENLGSYANPTADKLINASVNGTNPAAVRAESSFLTTNQPGLFQPNPDYIWAWKGVTGPAKSFASLTQYYAQPEFWSLTK